MFKKLKSQVELNELNKQADEDSKLLLNEELEVFEILNELNEVIKGGKARTHTPESIAKLHGVSVEKINGQIAKGIKVEAEHTPDEAAAREISMDHLVEFPDYYDRLDKMEADAKKELHEYYLRYEEILSEEKMPKNPEYALPEEKAYPLYDKLHVQMAIRMFNHIEPSKERKLAKRIIWKMKYHGMRKSNVGEGNRLKKYVDDSNLPD